VGGGCLDGSTWAPDTCLGNHRGINNSVWRLHWFVPLQWPYHKLGSSSFLCQEITRSPNCFLCLSLMDSSSPSSILVAKMIFGKYESGHVSLASVVAKVQGGWTGPVWRKNVRRGSRRVNMVEILCTQVWKWKNETCWNYSRIGERGDKGKWWRGEFNYDIFDLL
jgi:hypothetical protein